MLHSFRAVLTLLFSLLIAIPSGAQGEKRLHKIGLVLGSSIDRKLGDEILATVTDVFVSSRRFVMVERHKLDAIFTEKDLDQFLGQGSQKLSEVLGLDALGLVVYSVETKRIGAAETVARVTIEVRLVEVTTGKIIETVNSERPYSLPALTLREAGNYLSESLREKFPLFGYVVRVQGKEVIVDLGSDDGLKDGAALEVVRAGEQIIHPVTNQLLPPEWIVMGELKVVFVSPQTSTCWLRWGEDIQPGSRAFLKEDFSPFSRLIEKNDKAHNPPLERTQKEKKNSVLDWLRRIFSRRSASHGRVCGAGDVL